MTQHDRIEMNRKYVYGRICISNLDSALFRMRQGQSPGRCDQMRMLKLLGRAETARSFESSAVTPS